MRGLLAGYGLVLGLSWAAAGLLVVRDWLAARRRQTAIAPKFAAAAIKPAPQPAWGHMLGMILVGPVVVPCVLLMVMPLVVLRVGLVCGGSIGGWIAARRIRGG